MAKKQSTENDYPHTDEVWKVVGMAVPDSLAKLEVSNYGRVRSNSPKARAEFIKGANTRTLLTTIQQRYFVSRDEEEAAYIRGLRTELTMLRRDLRTRRRSVEARRKANEVVDAQELQNIKTDQESYDAKQVVYRAALKADDKKRGIRYGGYIHRFVANAFVERPSMEHKNVVHIDHNNQNNHSSNLKWVTHEGLVAHNNTNERIIKDRASRAGRFNKGNKLNESKVKALKSAMTRGDVSTKILAKEYGVSEAQIRHIRRGGSWAYVQVDDSETIG